jgi:hypothetical protein
MLSLDGNSPDNIFDSFNGGGLKHSRHNGGLSTLSPSQANLYQHISANKRLKDYTSTQMEEIQSPLASTLPSIDFNDREPADF